MTDLMSIIIFCQKNNSFQNYSTLGVPTHMARVNTPGIQGVTSGGIDMTSQPVNGGLCGGRGRG